MLLLLLAAISASTTETPLPNLGLISLPGLVTQVVASVVVLDVSPIPLVSEIV